MKRLFLIFGLLFQTIFCYTQTHLIFKDDNIYDSVFIANLKGVYFYNYYYSVPLYDFKEKLPDGTWIVYNTVRKDSSKKNNDEYISMIGQFKDSLRNGTFRYYLQCNYKKESRKIENITYNFKKGKLDGYYSSKNCSNKKRDEGFYKNGMKDGYFISYFREGQIEAIGLYKYDTLSEWSNYYKNGLIRSKGKGEGMLTNGEVLYFDSLGNNNRKEFYKNGKLLWFKEFYNNGVLQKSVEGEFGLCYTIRDASNKNKCLSYPINGTVIYYNEIGIEIKKENYENAKLKDQKN